MLNNRKSLKYLIVWLIIVIVGAVGGNAFADNLSVNEPKPAAKVESKKSTSVFSEIFKADEKPDQEADDEDDDEKMVVEEEQELMEKALEILDVADACWKRGDIENTLNNLDKAYALVLDTNGDIEISRQKDDLRQLISKRILALYSTKQAKTNGKASEIQNLMNPDIEKEIRSFQTVERDFFISSYQRSGLYRDLIMSELKKAGVPEELFWLPLVESGFKISALSSARALGLWQFIPSTGYKYGLTRDEWVDERMDVMKSTQAAIAYLKELHGMFGDWMTVLAAYNCGEGRVMRVISRQHINYFDRFWDLYNQLPNETARYVPRFLATLHIVKDPAKYGFDLKATTDAGLNYEKVKVNKIMKLADIAAKIDVSEDMVNILNAELRHKMTPDREYDLKIPKESLQSFNMTYNDIPETERPTYTVAKPSYVRHRTRAGETVSSIAKRYRVSTSAIYANNRINNKKRLVRGQIINIPVNRVEVASVKQKSCNPKTTVSDRRGKVAPIRSYKVKKGDSLLGIANRFKVDVKKLKAFNKLKSNNVQAGRVLKLPSEELSNVGDDEGEKKEKFTKVASADVKKKLTQAQR